MLSYLKRLRAFTILELTAVLVIVGVLAGLGAVAYTKFIDKSDEEVDVATAVAEARKAYFEFAADGVTDFEADVPGNVFGYTYRQVIMKSAMDAMANTVTVNIPVGETTDFEQWSVEAGEPTPPGATQNVSSSPASGEVTLNWEAPTASGNGSTVDGYIVSWTDSNGDPQAVQVDASQTSTTISGLENGHNYDFSVQAVSLAGDSTAVVVSAIPATHPSAPSGLSTTTNLDTVSLTWVTPTSDGGLPIDGYIVEVSSDTGANWTSYNSAGAGTSLDVESLTFGATYVFRVSAYNSVGTSTSSSTSGSVYLASAPDAPSNLSGVAGVEIADLSWDAPFDGGESISDYVVEYSTDGVNYTVFSDGISTATVTTVNSLTGDTTYRFRVSAVNTVGTSQTSVTLDLDIQEPFSATGGTMRTYVENGQTYQSHTFETGGILTLNGVPSGMTVDLLVVAGGGGGACSPSCDQGPGGGAGGYIEQTNVSVISGSYGALIGIGGTQGAENSWYGWPTSANNGGNSSMMGYTALGGGAAGFGYQNHQTPGVSGGSGGGGGISVNAGVAISPGGTATDPSQGNNAGSSYHGGSQGTAWPSGGGGACGASLDSTWLNASEGGPGCYNNFSTGADQLYAKGGDGCFIDSNLSGNSSECLTSYQTLTNFNLLSPGQGGHGGAQQNSWGGWMYQDPTPGTKGIVVVRYVLPS